MWMGRPASAGLGVTTSVAVPRERRASAMASGFASPPPHAAAKSRAGMTSLIGSRGTGPPYRRPRRLAALFRRSIEVAPTSFGRSVARQEPLEVHAVEPGRARGARNVAPVPRQHRLEVTLFELRQQR